MPESDKNWRFIPFNIVLVTISGSIIGFIVASIAKPPYLYFKFTIIQIAIGNIWNVPLVLIAALCRDKSNPFGDSSKCTQDGNAYISFGQWVGAIVLYTYVFWMLAPPPSGSFDIVECSLPIKAAPKSRGSPPEEVPLLTREPEPTNEDTPKDGKAIKFFKFLYVKLKLKQILQPPIIASLMSRCQAAYSVGVTVVEQTIGSIKTVASFTGEKQSIAYRAGMRQSLVAGLGSGFNWWSSVWPVSD